MEIQHGKGGNENFAILRLLLDAIPGDMKNTRPGVRGDAWLGSIWTANEVCLRGLEGVFQIKQCHSLFQKEHIESAQKYAPGGVHVILEGVTKDEIPLVAMRYRYNRKTSLFFDFCTYQDRRDDKAQRSLPNEIYRFIWQYLHP